jgi:hypothetical protein
MYKPHEIFAQMPTTTAVQLLGFLFEKEKPLYKATIDSLAKQRKLRPVFIEKKPREERFAWLKETLGKKQNEAIAAHLLQIWLVGGHRAVLCDFLDALKIEHDENGTIETLPPAPPKEELNAAIDTIMQKHDAAVVVIYLHAFQALDDVGWSTLEELLKEDPRLRLGEAVAA